MFRKAALALALGITLTSSGCASAAKYSFGADDFEMGYVDSAQGDRNVQMIDGMVAQQVNSLDAIVAQAANLTQPLPAFVKVQVDSQVGSFQNIVHTQVTSRAQTACHANAHAMVVYLSSYDLFAAKDPCVSYELIDRLKDNDGNAGAINPVIDRANDALKSAYRIKSQVNVARKLLDHVKVDIIEMKTKPDAVKIAGMCLVTVSVVRSSLTSFRDGQTLLPRLQATAAELQGTIQANPALALSLGGPSTQVAGAVVSMTSLATDVPALLASAVDVLKALTT